MKTTNKMTRVEVERMMMLAELAEDMLRKLPPWQRALKNTLVRQAEELLRLVRAAGNELRGYK